MKYLGFDDGEFIRGDVPMTKQEIRILTLAKAHISPEAVVYDIGAGTGSISIEAAHLAARGTVYAIERNPAGIALIKENARKFAVNNLIAVAGEAPEALTDLPPCDAVVIGGSGQKLDEIMGIVYEKLKKGGRVVLNCITIQTIASCLEYFRAHKEKFSYEAVQVQVSRLKAVGTYDMAKAENPIYLVTGIKRGEDMAS